MEHKLFDGIYVTFINLDRAPERRDFMEDQLRRLGLPFQHLIATDGQTFEFAPSELANGLTAQEFACARSHSRAWSGFLATGKEWALVMEDDIEIDGRLMPTLNELIGSMRIQKDDPIYIQFDYAAIGWNGVRLWWFLFGNLLKNQKTNPWFWLKLPIYLLKGVAANSLSLFEGARDRYFRRRNVSALYRVHKDRYLAGCYLISRSGAKALLETNTPIRYTADAVHNAARQRKELRHYICVPRLTRQKRERFPSYLNDDHFGNPTIAY